MGDRNITIICLLDCFLILTLACVAVRKHWTKRYSPLLQVIDSPERRYSAWIHPGLPDHPRREVDHQAGVRGAHRPPQGHLESSTSPLLVSSLNPCHPTSLRFSCSKLMLCFSSCPFSPSESSCINNHLYQSNFSCLQLV